MAAGGCAWHKTAVVYSSDRCLARWAPHVACEACLAVCPPKAIRTGERRIVSDGRCVGCGRCATVCPTGAIETTGYRPAIAAAGMAETDAPVVVECRRVPAADCPAGAVRLPCLGGLAEADLIDLRLAAGNRPVHLIDRGWCGACPAGGAEHPAWRVVERVARLLTEMGAAELSPALVSRPEPRRRSGARADDIDAVAAPGRRALLRRLTAAPEADEAPTRPLCDGLPVEPLARKRTHAALERLADRLGVPAAPSSFYATVSISGRCRNHQVCVAVCPTGALAADTGATAASVVFESVRCIACGACARHCPEHAISLQPEGRPRPGDSERSVLSRHPLRACEGCGRRFAEPGTATLCLSCRKTRAFAQAGSAFLFGVAMAPQDPQQTSPSRAATGEYDSVRA